MRLENWKKKMSNIVDYSYEIDRVVSFGEALFRGYSYKTWSIDYISGDKLAMLGFYYTGRYDICKCFFCNVVLSDWSDDCIFNIYERHFTNSSACPFLLNHAETNNKPINFNELCNLLNSRQSLVMSHNMQLTTNSNQIDQIVPEIEKRQYT